jgi:hypothetical protein
VEHPEVDQRGHNEIDGDKGIEFAWKKLDENIAI